MLITLFLRSLSGAVLAAGLALAVMPFQVLAQSDEMPSAGEGIEVPDASTDETPAPIADEVPDQDIFPTGSEDRERPSDREEGVFGRSNDPPPLETPPSAASPKPAPVDVFTPEKGKRAPSPMLESRGPDYYDRRAAELIKQDTNVADTAPHPLASAFPNEFVVVCTAGCRDGSSAMIVGMTAKAEPADKTAPGADLPGVVSCVGGCPGGGRGTFIAMPSPAAGGARVAATIGEWMTTVAKAPAEAGVPDPRGGSGDWMAKINAERTSGDRPKSAAEPKPTAAVEPPKAAAPPAAPAQVAVKPAAAEPKPMAAIEAPKVVDPPAAPPQVEVKAAAIEPKPTAAVEPPKAAAPPAAPPQVEVKPAAAEPKPMAAIETPKVVEPPAAPAQVPVKPAASEPKPTAAIAPPADKPAAGTPPTDKVVSVLSEDKEMNAAIEKARATLPSFWQSNETPGPNEADFALKVAITGNGNTEHFWLTRIKREGDKLSGIVSNEPQSVKTVKLGERYTFTSDMISDWTFKRNGKLVGNETMRVLLPRMPEEQASVYRQMYETP